MCAPRTDKSVLESTRRVTLWGFCANLVLSGVKITAGALGHSQAVLADGVHSLSDTGTDVSILLGAHYWSKPPDSSHPYGHQRIETLITTGIGVALLAAGAGIAYHALATLHTPRQSAPGWITLAAAVLSIVSKETLYRWTMKVGKRIQSSAVIANGLHHRTDALSSAPVAVAVLVARLLPRWSFLDQLAGMFVSIFIIWSGWTVVWPALKELVDAGASEQELKNIRKIARETAGVNDVHGVRTRYLAGHIIATLHVLVDDNLPVKKGHEIAENVKQRLLDDGPDVIDAIVHLEPVSDGNGAQFGP